MFLRATFIATCLVLFSAFPAWGLRHLSSVSYIKEKYVVAGDYLLISWNAVQGAARYRIEVQSLDGREILARSVRTISTKLSGNLLADGEMYVVRLRVLGSSKSERSKVKTKQVSFSTRVASAEEYREIHSQNEGGRKGWLYLPKNYRLQPHPVLVLFHGSLINGKAQLDIFKSLARANGLALMAPDSVDPAGWSLSLDPQNPSADQRHIANCLEELLSIPHLSVEKFVVAGVSAGGGVAAYYGSNDSRFGSFAVLHGGVDFPSLGSRRVPVWLSTGTTDELRTPQELQSYQIRLRVLGFPSVDYHEYPVAHEVASAEKSEFVAWAFG